MSTQEGTQLAAAGEALGLQIDDSQIGQITRYLDLLERWNRTYNLTAVRERQEMLLQHVVDCMAVVAPLERRRSTHSSDRRFRCLDVGSGGGLPAVILSILSPGIDVVSVDTVGKKASFVRQVALELQLRNLGAEHARVEQFRAKPFDLITSRAFASLADFVRLTAALLMPEGAWMAMKGQVPDDEIAALPPGIDVFHVEHLTIPGLSAARCLVWMAPRPGLGSTTI